MKSAFTLSLFLFISTVLTAQPALPFCSNASAPLTLANTCLDACRVCDLDGFEGATGVGFGQLPGNFCGVGPAGWVAFTALSADLTLSILTDGCFLAAGLYGTDDCQNFIPVSDCAPNIPPATPVPIVNTVPLNIGDTYFLVVSGDACSFEVSVANGNTQYPSPTGPPPSIDAPSTVCPGGALPYGLSDDVPNAVTYDWTVNGAPIGTEASGVYPAPDDLPDGTQFNLCVTVSNPCHPPLPQVCTSVLVEDPPVLIQTDSICLGDAYSFFGQTITPPGAGVFFYTTTLTDASGCEQTVELELTVLPPPTPVIIDATICEGDSYAVGSTVYTNPGTYTNVLTAANGCDSLVILNLTVEPVAETFLPGFVCPDEPFIAGSEIFFEPGFYTIPLIAANGCDSIVYLELEWGWTEVDLGFIELSVGETFEFRGESYNQSGQTNVVAPNPDGCDTLFQFRIFYPDPPNDDCSTAAMLPLGDLPDCPAGGITRDTFTVNNFGAGTGLVRTRFPCTPDDDLLNLRADIWYEFTAPGNLLSLHLLETETGRLDFSFYRLNTDDCARRLPVACAVDQVAVDSAGVPLTYPFLDLQVERGATYLLRIAGAGAVNEGFFTFELIAEQNCDPCRREGRLTVAPLPYFDTYQTGQNVQICYELTHWDAGTEPVRLHALLTDLGAAWMPGTVDPDPPASCEGTGEWTYADSWIAGGNSLSFGPGFVYNRNPDGVADTAGDGEGSCTDVDSATGSRLFCWTMTVGGDTLNCPSDNFTGDASLSVLPQSAAVTGAGPNPECVNGAVNGFAQLFFGTACCEDPPPQIQVNAQPTCNACDGSITFESGPGLLYAYRLLDADDNLIAEFQRTSQAVTVDSLCPGLYKVAAFDNDGCREVSTVILSPDPGPSFEVDIVGTDSLLCPGQVSELTAVLTPDLPGATYAWSTGETTESIFVDQAGFYDVTVTTGGCEDSAGYGVGALPGPNVTITAFPDSLVCAGELVNLQATLDFASYNWLNGEVGPVSTRLVNGPQTATVIVTDTNGCTGEAAIQLDTLPAPAPPVVICGAADTESVTFEWTLGPNTTFVNVSGPAGTQDGNTYTVSGLNPGETVEITVTPFNNGGCAGPSVTHVCTTTTCDNFSVSIDPVGTVCVNAPAFELTATVTGGDGTGMGTWSGPGITDAAAGLFDPASAGPGQHPVTFSFTEGNCTLEDNLVLTVDPVLTPPVITCSSTLESVTFGWNDAPGAAGFQVEILTGQSGALDGTSFTVTGLLPEEEVTILVTALSTGACPDVSSTLTCAAEACPDLTLSFTPLPDTLCLFDDPVTIEASLSGGDGSGTFDWSGPGLTSAQDSFATFDPLTSGAGAFTVFLLYTEGLCQVSLSHIFTVLPQPEASFGLSTDTVCVNETVEVTFTGSTQGNAVFTWDFDGGTADPGMGAGPQNVSWDVPGEKTLSLAVEENGCVSGPVMQTVFVAPSLATPVVSCQPEGDQITFTWNDVPGATGYDVAVLNGPAGQLSGNQYIVDGLSLGEEVTIQVIALGDGPCGDSEPAVLSCTAITCPDVTFIIDPLGPICLSQDDSPVLLSATITGGSGGGMLIWEGPGVDPAGVFDPAVAGTGSHLLVATYTEGDCSYAAATEVIVSTSAQLSDIDAVCTGDGNYIVTLTVSTADTIFDFQSDLIPSGEMATFDFPLSPGCPPAGIAITKNCDCTADVGDFTAGPLVELCTDESLLLPDFTPLLGPDDALQYVLHDNSGNVLGEAILVSDEPVLTWSDAILPGQTYYFSPVAGPDLGDGSADLDDPCLSVAPGQPVRFLSLPSLTVMDDPVLCQGQSVTLQAQTDGIAQLWTPAGGLTCDDCLNPIAQPDSTTTYTVLAAGANGCTAEASVTVFVDAFPGYAIPEIDPVCPGQPYEFCLPDAQSFLWTGPNGYTSTTQCLVWNEITEEVAGTYTVDIRLDDQCTITEVIEVDLAPPVVVNDFPADTTVCPLQLVPLQTDIEGAVGYQWFPQEAVFCRTCPNTFAMVYKNTTLTLLIFDENGCTTQESLTITMASGCGGIGDLFDILIPPLPLDPPEEEGPTLRLYPNPVRSVLTVEVANTRARRLQVFDSGGRLVREQVVNGSLRTELAVSDLRGGAYLLRMVTEEGVLVERFLITK